MRDRRQRRRAVLDRAGHGDAMHFTDIDPDRPGLEVFKANGDGRNPAGIQLRDARTGEQIFGIASTRSGGVGRAWRSTSTRATADWRCGASTSTGAAGAGDASDGVAAAAIGQIAARGVGERAASSVRPESPRSRNPADSRPVLRRPWGAHHRCHAGTCNMGIWWDGDVLRELLDGVRVSKWDYENERQVDVLDGERFRLRCRTTARNRIRACVPIFWATGARKSSPARATTASSAFSSQRSRPSADCTH